MLFFPIFNKISSKRKGRASFHDSPRDQIGEASREERVPYAVFIGSLTVEAAFILPLFVMAIMVLLFFVQAIQMQIQIQKALFNQTVKTAGYSYYLSKTEIPTEAESFLEAEFIKLNIANELGTDFFKNGYIVNGENGFVLNFSNISDEGIIDIALQYKMQVPFDIFGVGKLNFVARARCRTWDGKHSDITGYKGNMVYVTPNGEVYHMSDKCTYIVKRVNNCSYHSIDEKRNSSGGIYYPCNLCAESKTPIATQIVYFTDYGTRYHLEIFCSNLKTNIFAINEDVAKKKYRACSKCGTGGIDG